MSKIERFEDIEAWKKGRELAKGICKVTARGEFARDYGLKDQIRRAVVSVISNIAEGFSRQTDQEFVQFLHISYISPRAQHPRCKANCTLHWT